MRAKVRGDARQFRLEGHFSLRGMAGLQVLGDNSNLVTHCATWQGVLNLSCSTAESFH